MAVRTVLAVLFCWLLALPAWAQQTDSAGDLPTTAILHTSEGAITLKLFADKAPITVANFVEYARSGFYEGTIFHRVVPRFVIQGGGFTKEMMKKAVREPIVNEAKSSGLNNDRWTVAMARTREPDSATSQFFINLRTNTSLDPLGDQAGYAVFANVVEGKNVARDIADIPTRAVGPHANVPVRPVMIERVELQP